MTKYQTINSTLANSSNASQALNQTAQNAANAGSQGMLQDPVFLGVVAASLLLLPVALILNRYSSTLRDKLRPDYEATTLKERLNDKQVKPAVEFGSKPNKKVDYGPGNEMGECEKIYKTTEKTAEDILDEIHDKDPADIEDLKDDDLSKENKSYENLTIIVGPTAKFSRLKMRFRSTDPVSNPYLSVYSPPASRVNIGDRIVIDDKVDWNYAGGIYYSKDVQGVTTMYNYSALSLIDDLTKVFANKGEITQALNEKFAEWKQKKEVENQAFIDYMKEKEGIDADSATD